MSDDKKNYRFTGGKHYAFVDGAHRLLKPGETVEMTDAVFYGVRDRFELVVSETEPETETETETEPVSKPSVAEAATLLMGNVEHSRAAIKSLRSNEVLDAVEAAERADKARSGVLKAIESRRAELAE